MREDPVPSCQRPSRREQRSWFGRWRLTTDVALAAVVLNAKRGAERPLPVSLPADTELRDECPVPLDVVAPEVVEQPAPPADEHEQPALAVEVLLVHPHVLGQVPDAVREERDLDLGRAGVGLVLAVL